jgi:allophanate hydrolase
MAAAGVMQSRSLEIPALQDAYASGALRPTEVVAEVYRRISARGNDHVWMSLVDPQTALDRARRLEQRGAAGLPLYGIPFSVKDNIHVAGMRTTAGCPTFGSIASRSATAVTRAEQAGAILIGKNNMDHFATGLVGVRTLTGYCRNSFDPDYIPGGSSSGSGVAVASGLVSFSLGSDTGGSGRVPAAHNNIVGLKPTPGAVSSAGMLYCNRTFDCMPVFALTCGDAWKVFEVIRGPDDADPYSHRSFEWKDAPAAETFTFSMPSGGDLTFFGDARAEQAFSRAVRILESCGGRQIDIDYAPFREATAAVFGGPMLAERLVDYGHFIADHAAAVHPVVVSLIDSARRFSAEQVFESLYRLQELRVAAANALQGVDALIVPTAATIYRCDEVEDDPVKLNHHMGRYTYFVNPLDLSALAVPAGMRTDGLPFGISFIGPAGSDLGLRRLGERFSDAVGGTLGAGGWAPHKGRRTVPDAFHTTSSTERVLT